MKQPEPKQPQATRIIDVLEWMKPPPIDESNHEGDRSIPIVRLTDEQLAYAFKTRVVKDHHKTTYREIRVSSNPLDTDPANLSMKLVKNKINHLEFKPELFSEKTIKRIRKILDEKLGPHS